MGKSRKRQTILVVDDMPDNISLLSSILSGEYKVKGARDGDKATKITLDDPPDLILLDVMMPHMDGYEVCRILKSDPRTKHIPVIFVSALSEIEDEKAGFDCGAADYITKPVSPPIVLARVRTHLALYDQKRELEQMVTRQTERLMKSRSEIIRRLGRAAEFRDNETGLHVIRMSYYCKVIAEAMGMIPEEQEIILNATPMHDVGKIGIPDDILQKPGKLTDEERQIIQKHAEYGAEIIGIHDDPLLKTAWRVALTHHEKWDGSGYPRGLAGEEIPIAGRITAIADVFDALTSNRPYKEAWPVEKALELIEKEKGHHFDPAVASLFIENFDRIERIMKKHADQAVQGKGDI